MLTTLFLLYYYIFFGVESNEDDKSDKSDGGGSGSDFTSGSCFSQSDVEIGSDRIISIRVE